MEKLQHVTVKDNGAAFLVTVDGLTVYAGSTLAAAWEHIVWMHTISSQQFTVGPNKTPVRQWMACMYHAGWMADNKWCRAAYEDMQAETDLLFMAHN